MDKKGVNSAILRQGWSLGSVSACMGLRIPVCPRLFARLRCLLEHPEAPSIRDSETHTISPPSIFTLCIPLPRPALSPRLLPSFAVFAVFAAVFFFDVEETKKK